MRKITRLATCGVALLAASALVGGVAGAQGAGAGADTYGARATAEALTISVAGNQLTGSKVTADLNNNLQSSATASELLIPGVAKSDDLKASASGADSAGQTVKPASCLGSNLEAVPGVARFELVCPEVTAKVNGVLPYARGLGAQLVLEPSVSNVLSTLGLQDTVNNTTNQVFEQVINPLVQALTGTPLEQIAQDGVNTVQDVLQRTLTLDSTARIVIAPALAEVTSTADTITATAHAQGIRIELLPVNGAGATNNLLPDDLTPGKPLVTITIGNAQATATYNRITGAKGKPTGSAGAVTIEFGSTKITDALGLSAKPIVVGENTEQCVLTGTPLETCVTVAKYGVDADGNPYATSTSVALFKGVNGGIDIATGGVTSGSAGAPAAALAAAPDLPRTGANPALPFLGAGLLALGVLVRKTIIARA
ncbi:MAG: hypothetical protein QOI47_1982 [Actinomycetota bacterium]|jgi:hypothetical protein|nr:hypothetical protein [Actinomycetota bacterium]